MNRLLLIQPTLLHSKSNLHSQEAHRHRINFHPSLRRSIAKHQRFTTIHQSKSLRPTHPHFNTQHRQQWVSSNQASNTAALPTPSTVSAKAWLLTRRARQLHPPASMDNSHNNRLNTPVEALTMISLATCTKIGVTPLVAINAMANRNEAEEEFNDWGRPCGRRVYNQASAGFFGYGLGSLWLGF